MNQSKEIKAQIKELSDTIKQKSERVEVALVKEQDHRKERREQLDRIR